MPDHRGPEGAVVDCVRLHPWGTPEQVLEKLAFLRDHLGLAGIQASFSIRGMAYEVVESSLRLLPQEVLPAVRGWDSGPTPMPSPHVGPAGAGRTPAAVS